MTYLFGDGFDAYALASDALLYWTGGSGSGTIVNGRFPGSFGMLLNGSGTTTLYKDSGVNDTVHHIIFSLYQISALSGTTYQSAFTLSDGTNAQCTIALRSDGTIFVLGGDVGASVIATYINAFSASLWVGIEIEVVISSTVGSVTIRENGHTINDFQATNLNTQNGSANNYANRLNVSSGSNFYGGNHAIDDVLWQSGSSVSWAGDIRCYTRRPASDQSVTWSPLSSVLNQGLPAGMQTSTTSIGNSVSLYSPFSPACNGTLSSLTITVLSSFTGNLKIAIFADNGSSAPGIALTSPIIVSPVIGNNVFTLATPISITYGTIYWWGLCSDNNNNNAILQVNGTYPGFYSSSSGFVSYNITYSSFPTSNPTTSYTCSPYVATFTITPSNGINYAQVADSQQDGSNSYVTSATTNNADFYGITALSGSPSTVLAVTTRAIMNKSDSGTRVAAVQLKSGSTIVQSPQKNLTTTFQCAWRTDIVDPNTSTAWTAAAVNNVQIGPIVIL